MAIDRALLKKMTFRATARAVASISDGGSVVFGDARVIRYFPMHKKAREYGPSGLVVAERSMIVCADEITVDDYIWLDGVDASDETKGVSIVRAPEAFYDERGRPWCWSVTL